MSMYVFMHTRSITWQQIDNTLHYYVNTITLLCKCAQNPRPKRWNKKHTRDSKNMNGLEYLYSFYSNEKK